jgi:hypothetical protein
VIPEPLPPGATANIAKPKDMRAINVTASRGI